jgi:hypothetical protein
MSQSQRLTVLCLSSIEKGHEFMQECARQGCRVLLLTNAKHKDKPWPRESIDEMFLVPAFDDQQALIHTVSYLARDFQIDRIVPMDDYDVERASALREHLRVPGMGDSTVRFFRDKLAMRVQAKDEGLRVPDFVHVLSAGRIVKSGDKDLAHELEQAGYAGFEEPPGDGTPVDVRAVQYRGA